MFSIELQDGMFRSAKSTSHAQDQFRHWGLITLNFIKQSIFLHHNNMASSNIAFRCVARLRLCTRCSNAFRVTPPAARSIHSGLRIPAITASSSRLRPKTRPFLHQPSIFSQSAPAANRRTIFIQTENTPNADVGETELPLSIRN